MLRPNVSSHRTTFECDRESDAVNQKSAVTATEAAAERVLAVQGSSMRSRVPHSGWVVMWN
jgi:hypothetical protein